MEVMINNVRYVPYLPKAEGEAVKALDVSFFCYDLQRTMTVREYFHALLTTLWEEEDGFSGKRPFGNSSWKYDVIYALINAGFIDGTISYDAQGYVEESSYDASEADYFIMSLMTSMCLGE